MRRPHPIAYTLLLAVMACPCLSSAQYARDWDDVLPRHYHSPVHQWGLIDVLLESDFVVEGTVLENKDLSPDVLEIDVSSVHLGAVPHRRIRIGTLPTVPGVRVLAWGYLDSGNCDKETFSGGHFVIDDDGSMYPSRGYRWLSKPGACARLISALSARQDEHAADWLASGQGIALMRVVTMDALQHIVTVEPVRVLTGTPAPMPRYVRWLAQNCPTTPVLNGELLLPIYGTPVDTMTVKACMGPLRVGAGMRSTPYGVALDRIGDVVQSTPHGMRLERLHGVPLNCEPRH